MSNFTPASSAYKLWMRYGAKTPFHTPEAVMISLALDMRDLSPPAWFESLELMKKVAPDVNWPAEGETWSAERLRCEVINSWADFHAFCDKLFLGGLSFFESLKAQPGADGVLQ